jgi:hypothetical protein
MLRAIFNISYFIILSKRHMEEGKGNNLIYKIYFMKT